MSEACHRPVRRVLFAGLLLASAALPADQRALSAKYQLSTVNAEGEFVSTGSTLVLRVNGLVAAYQSSCSNEYKDGKIVLAKASKGICSTAVKTIGLLPGISGIPKAGGVVSTVASNAPPTRRFVAGEKVWVTRIEVKDAIVFNLVSDKISDVYYTADLRFDKAGGMQQDRAEQLIAEVFGIAAEAAPVRTARAPAPAPAASPTVPAATAPGTAEPPTPAPAVSFAPIAAPPPPPADSPALPKRAVADAPALPPIAAPLPPSDRSPSDQSLPSSAISAGLTIDQVTGALGPPRQTVDLGPKKIYTYPAVKVIFIDGKVTEVRDPATNALIAGADSSPAGKKPIDYLPYEIGLGAVAVAVAAFFLGHKRGRSVAIPPIHHPHAAMPMPPPPIYQHTPAPTYQPPPAAQAHPAPAHEERLKELETLMVLGILTPVEFEQEKLNLGRGK